MNGTRASRKGLGGVPIDTDAVASSLCAWDKMRAI
jgi:hypothetical protein